MKCIRIGGIETRPVNGLIELSGAVCGLGRLGDQRLWFRFPESVAGGITPLADPFLAALLPIAMAYGLPLVVEGQVSWRLVQSSSHLMRLWSWQNPTRKPIAVTAQPSRQRFTPRATASFFSGGVDSFNTLLKNLDCATGDDRIRYLLCVLGYDLRCDNEEMYAHVTDRLRLVSDSVGVTLIEVRTNLRDVSDPVLSWPHGELSAGLGAVGLALGPMLRRVLVPSGSTPLESALLSPTNPLADPLWSTDSTEFIHDGCELTPQSRVRLRIAKSELALKHLRVCHANIHRGSAPDWNCGRCHKCVRTMVLMRAAGALDRCPAFDKPLDLDLVRQLRLDPRWEYPSLVEAQTILEEEGRDPELQTALRFMMRPSRRIAQLVIIHLKDALRRLLGRRGQLRYRQSRFGPRNRRQVERTARP